ncbi:MAG: hypothetical protein JST12_04095 [Armatimonadetes bacterium]|nr:hypothetical protein [Armatimonadota bacterium]MBS1700819.1 hypothetical protein [Armatimonadota bacterium]MBS1726458.1 hypothetical protein [Armatimonadota bacterium]
MGKRAFQVLTIVRLRAPETPVPDTDEDERIQAEHIAYLTGLKEQGILLLNGPVRRVDDSRFLGMSIYSVGVDEARAFALADPGVKAGWFEIEADKWLLPCIPTMMGDRVDLEL